MKSEMLKKEIPPLLVQYRKYKADVEKKKHSGIHDYSLINALLKKNDEVKLHSRFIYSMLNPKGLHYCGNRLLKLFFQQIKHPQICGFINFNLAKVYREKGNIDLLIHDGEHFVIIENKLDAKDQKNQITRYVQYIQEKFLPDKKDLSKNIAIVYLSKNRQAPSSDSQSLIGFSGPTKGQLEWQGLSKPYSQSLSKINLNIGTTIPFYHLGYFPVGQNGSVREWVEDCKAKHPHIKTAFDEYSLILDRLDHSKNWRKVMTLSDYVLEQKYGDEQDLYRFMCESSKSLEDFVTAKLYRELENIFGEPDIQKYGPVGTIEVKELTLTSLKNWIKKNPSKKQNGLNKWERIGFVYRENTKSSDGIVLVFAAWHLYFDYYNENKNVLDAKNRKIEIGKGRELLLNGGLYDVIDRIKERKKELDGVK